MTRLHARTAARLVRDRVQTTVLLVEDEPSIAVTLADELADGGYAVTRVDNGAAAVELLAVQAFPVVVTDLRLPGASGLAVLRAAKASSPQSRVLVISAYLDGHREALLQQGAEALLQKPFANEQVLAWLRGA